MPEEGICKPHTCTALFDATKTFFINSKINTAIQNLDLQSCGATEAKNDAVRMHANGTALSVWNR